jgi:F-type H+-transporting ATPase subunit b
MPQLDFSTFPPQLIWLAITFLLLYALMTRVALPRVGAVIDARRDKIDGDLDAARKMKAEMEIVAQAYERTLAEARVKAAATLSATKDKLAGIAAEKQRESLAALAARTAAAEARIDAAKRQALGNIREIAVDAAGQAAFRLIGEAVDTTRVSAAVDQVMGDQASGGRR